MCPPLQCSFFGSLHLLDRHKRGERKSSLGSECGPCVGSCGRPPGPGRIKVTRRVPGLLLKAVAVVEQDLRRLKVVDSVEKQRRPVPSVQSEGMKQVCEFPAPHSRPDRSHAAPERNSLGTERNGGIYSLRLAHRFEKYGRRQVYECVGVGQ